MNTGSGASASFLRKNHNFYHPITGSYIKKQKYGSTLSPDWTKMSTPPHTATSTSKPYHNWVRKLNNSLLSFRHVSLFPRSF
jgi:hypothetical protein